MSTNATTTSPQAGAAAAEASPPPPAGLSFRVGDLVQVQARTWANMNQPGGVARITGVFVHDSTDAPGTGALSSSSDAAMMTTTTTRTTDRTNSNASAQALSKGPDGTSGDKAQVHVSVRYVLDGRHERRVHVRYVAAYALHDEQHHRFRDRSALLGRCTYCGSLRSDCGSCDQQQILNRQIHQRPASATTKHSSPGRKKRGRTLAISERPASSDDDDSTSSSSSSVDLDKLVERQRHIDRMYKRLQARRLKMQQQQQSQSDLHGSNRRRTSHDPSINTFSTINVSGSRGRPLPRRRRRLQNAQDSLALVTANPIGSTRAADRSGHRTAHGDTILEPAGFPNADDDDSCSSSSSKSASSSDDDDDDDDEEVGLGVFLTRHRNRYLTTLTGGDRRIRRGMGSATVATPAKALADTLDRRASSQRRGRPIDSGVRRAAASRVRRFRVVQREDRGDDPRAATRQDPRDSRDGSRPIVDDIEIDQYSDVSDQGQVEQSSSGGSSSDASSPPPPAAGAATMTRRSRRDVRRMSARSDGSTTSNVGAAMDVDDSSCGLSYQGGGGGDDGDDGDAEVPSQLVDLNFVQPEGDAFQIPNDLVDQTAGLPFDQLPAFFDDRLALMRQQLRVAKRELRDLERQQRAAMGTIQAASASADWRRSWYETLQLVSFPHSSFYSLTVFPILFSF
jgi:hypothetical protein